MLEALIAVDLDKVGVISYVWSVPSLMLPNKYGG
jgi:hypothetical protein